MLYAAWGLWSLGFRSVSEMDWDGDGWVTPPEILTALDTVKTPSMRPGCTDYLDAKGGVEIRATRCEAADRRAP